MEVFGTILRKFSFYINSPEFISLVINNRFYMVLLVVILLRCKYSTYRSMWVCALINIPGTFLHELMHLMVGAFMNARPCNFSIFPKRSMEGGYVMGSVSFANITFYNAVPSAMAPLLLLPIGFYLNRYWLPNLDVTIGNYVFYIFLQTVIVENSIPSGADFRVAGKYFSGVLIYLILLVLFLFYV